MDRSSESVALVEDQNRGLDNRSVSLSLQGRQIVAIFNDFRARSVEDRLSDEIRENFKYEVERFHFWANSIGLFHQGHSSLDYRLRDSGKLIEHIERLLIGLQQALRLCKDPLF